MSPGGVCRSGLRGTLHGRSTSEWLVLRGADAEDVVDRESVRIGFGGEQTGNTHLLYRRLRGPWSTTFLGFVWRFLSRVHAEYDFGEGDVLVQLPILWEISRSSGLM